MLEILSNRLRDTHLQPADLAVDVTPVNGVPSCTGRRRTSGRSHRHLHSSITPVLQVLSRRSTRWTSAPSRAGHRPYPPHYRTAFASSTFPPRTTIGWPYGSLAPACEAEARGSSRSTSVALLDHVGPTRTPVTQDPRWATLERPDLATHLLVQADKHLQLVVHYDAAVVCMC